MKLQAAAKLNRDEIPIIDLGPYFNGTAEAAEQTAAKLRWVQEEIGFYYLINHGIPDNLIQKALEQVQLLHDLPIERKLDLKVDSKTTGYVPIRSTVYVSSNVNNNTKKEGNAKKNNAETMKKQGTTRKHKEKQRFRAVLEAVAQ